MVKSYFLNFELKLSVIFMTKGSIKDGYSFTKSVLLLCEHGYFLLNYALHSHPPPNTIRVQEKISDTKAQIKEKNIISEEGVVEGGGVRGNQSGYAPD